MKTTRKHPTPFRQRLDWLLTFYIEVSLVLLVIFGAAAVAVMFIVRAID